MSQQSATTRRGFLGQAAIGVAAALVVTSPAESQIVWTESQWKFPAFDPLLHSKRKVRLVAECNVIEGGEVVGAIRNVLNAVHYGFGVPMDQIQVVAALHGAANLMNYDDYIWQKYKVGEWFKLDDPETGKPAVRNFFYPSNAGADLHYTSTDPNNPGSAEMDTSIQGLQARGVTFLSCHMATEAQARILIKRFQLSAKPEEVVHEMLAHTVPGVIVVPGVVGTVTMLQSVGHYSYLKIV
jgi:intracellular sulfur oxidation DsrE/DsrF family protein